MRKSLTYLSFIYIAIIFYSCQDNEQPRFRLVNPTESGINFNNTIKENDSVNVVDFLNVYNGGGVAVGDINNDGMLDAYFSGNMVSGRLYLNKGNLKFDDISNQSGIMDNRWGTGVTMVDINQDGWLDIYVSVSGGLGNNKKANLLYINNHDLTFTESAAEYGLADETQSVQAAFFDYDKDGDLDLYLLVNAAKYWSEVNTIQKRKLNGESLSNDKLYRNDGNGKFTDVSKEAGILVEGYGLGVGISDINNDGWPDIYVSNDFIGNDILYINQGDGTFKDKLGDHINHTSYAGMGNDIADINNNGEPDIMVVDMRPEDNKRQKMVVSSNSYDRFQLMLEAGYDPQYSRNTLQLNQGNGKFSEIGFLAGVSSTDWSWSPLFADFDNDGHKDLYITNGFLRDLGNLDYIHYQNDRDSPMGDRKTKIKQTLKSIQNLPSAKLRNYIYRNKGDITFKDVSEDWGIDELSVSHGSAYADLDNDGDLDLLVNNTNQAAFLYENLSNKTEQNFFLRVKLIGRQGNLDGIGAKIKITTASQSQHYQHFLSRGYQSSIDPIIHFGLGGENYVKSIEVWWPNDSYQVLKGITGNQTITINQSDSKTQNYAKNDGNSHDKWLNDVTDSLEILYSHIEDPMVDFKLQPILPHMHSRNGPGVAVSDVNSDGLEDFYIGAAAGQPGTLMIQQNNNKFKTILFPDEKYEDMGALFFDVNNDGYQDLYVVSGGVQVSTADNMYQDRIYINDGKGNFTKSENLPRIIASGSSVTAVDFDKDGDLDIFVGGRVNPGKYPMPAKSYLFENLTEKGSNLLKFKDISPEIKGWEKLTMVTSSLWSDYDNDGWVDLIVTGEFMPIIFFHNENGKLIEVEPKDLKNTEGWWNSIAGADFDNDGDTDYILGNQGLNNKFKASPEEPLSIYAKDFDNDGRIDPVMSYFINGENQISHSRDEIIKQMNVMRVRFKTYQSYAETTFNKSFLPEELEDAYVVKSYNFATSYLENLGDGNFKLHQMPLISQISPVEGIVVDDINQDGNLDVLLTGNAYQNEVSTGRYDASKGALLKGNGDGSFKVVPLEESGFVNDFDGSGLGILRDINGNTFVLSANNNGPLKVFETNYPQKNNKTIFVDDDTQFATIFYKNGDQQKLEFYYGFGYLSQSTRSILINDKIKKIQTTNFKGIKRNVYNEKVN